MSDKGLPINEENLRHTVEWAASLPEQARRAVAANGPKIAAAMESFRDALRIRHSDGDVR